MHDTIPLLRQCLVEQNLNYFILKSDKNLGCLYSNASLQDFLFSLYRQKTDGVTVVTAHSITYYVHSMEFIDRSLVRDGVNISHLANFSYDIHARHISYHSDILMDILPFTPDDVNITVVENNLWLLSYYLRENQVILINHLDHIAWLTGIRALRENTSLENAFLLVTKRTTILFSTHVLEPVVANICHQHISTLYETLGLHIGDIAGDHRYIPTSLVKRFAIKNSPLLWHYQRIKSPSELKNSRQYHALDSASMIQCLHWIYTRGIGFTEYEISQKITSIKEKREEYIAPSFTNIVGFKENSTTLHYHPRPNNSRKAGGVLLLDIGGHYRGASTDISRTIYIGDIAPSQSLKTKYTLVLKSHLSFSRMFTPDRHVGSQVHSALLLLHPYACPHAFGHGVGNVLSIHEPGWLLDTCTYLSPGNVFSNEPGIYQHEGIRIENVQCMNYDSDIEDLTLIPYARDLVDISMLSYDEVQQLKHYEKRIKLEVAPYLSRRERAFLLSMFIW